MEVLSEKKNDIVELPKMNLGNTNVTIIVKNVFLNNY